MERFNPFKGFVRNEEGDRPKVKLPCNNIVIPKRIGFKKGETEIQVSEEIATEFGWGEAIAEVLGPVWDEQLAKRGIVFEE